jgi:glycosyltransferase involved in cell wall biosynthesis
MKRRILILPSWYPNETSPVNGIFIQEQAKALSKKYEVAVLVPMLVSWRQCWRRRLVLEFRGDQSTGLTVYRELAFVPFPRALRIIYFCYVAAAKKGLSKILAEWGKPDIIHTHVVLPAGWAAVRLGKRYHIPIVLTEHSSPFSVHLGSAYQQNLVREVLTKVDRIIAVSPALAQQVSAFQNGLKISVMGNHIRTDFFEPLDKVKKPSDSITRFLSIGVLTEQKGLTYLVEAAHLLLQRGVSPFEVIIGGDGRERDKLQKMVEVYRLYDRFRFLGMLTPSEVRYWMQQCDVFVLPSLHETFGIVLGEAMACGKPVISTRCGGAEFVVTPKTGILVNVADPIALAEAMEGFIKGKYKFDDGLIRKSVVERFGEEIFIRNISKLYEEVWSGN